MADDRLASEPERRSADRNRIAPPGSPGGAAAFASLLWGLVAFLRTDSILLSVVVFLAVLTTLEAIAGFTAGWLD